MYINAAITCRPALQDLMAVFYNKVADKWEPIGIYLHLPMATLKAIAAQHQRNPHMCLMGMLEVWLKRVDPPLPGLPSLRLWISWGRSNLQKRLERNIVHEFDLCIHVDYR